MAALPVGDNLSTSAAEGAEPVCDAPEVEEPGFDVGSMPDQRRHGDALGGVLRALRPGRP